MTYEIADNPQRAARLTRKVLSDIGAKMPKENMDARGKGTLGAPDWKGLHGEKKEVRTAMRAILDHAESRGRDLNDSEAEAFEFLNGWKEGLEGDLDQASSLGGGAVSGVGGPRGEGARLGPKDSVAAAMGGRSPGYGVGDLVRAQITGNWDGLDFQAAQSVGDGSAGGFAVPAELSSQVIDLSRNQARVIQAGATTIPVATGSTTFATIEKDPEAHWRAENTAIPESELSLGARNFKAQTLAVLVRASLELIEDAPNINQLIERAISEQLALKLDKMCLLGTGAGRPLGLYNADGVHRLEIAPDGDALETFDPLSSAVEKVRGDNAEPGDFIMASRTSGEIDRLKDQDGNPLLAPRSVREREFLVSNQVPVDLQHGASEDSSAIFTGQWEDLYVTIRTGMTLEATRVGGDAFKNMQVLIRGYLRADAFAVRPGHFAIIEGITPPAPEA